MSIATKTGDTGETSLGDGSRSTKDDCRVEAYGDIDELNSLLGLILQSFPSIETKKIISRIQHELFRLGADLIGKNKISAEHVDKLSADLKEIESQLEPISYFIIPRGTSSASQLHIARTVCRRAERHTVGFSKEAQINPEAIRYLNRLSDVLFTLARWENKLHGIDDKKAEF